MTQRKNYSGPNYAELIAPVYKALVELDGSGSNSEIQETVINMLKLPDNVVDELHKGAANQRTELDYQLAWAKSYLKAYGAITNTSRGVWMITPEYADKKEIDAKKVVKAYSNRSKKTNFVDDSGQNIKKLNNDDDEPEELEPWRNELAEVVHSMDPFGFERLSQLLLRECGFSQIIVTKKTGDGGIDGTGKLLINGIFSFNVAFQCKRYSGSVTAGDIRDFRGSLTTDIEKGVFITTGTFTRDAKKEASNAGKQQIDLIDGEEFIDKLIECGIGVKEKTVYEVNKEFFKKL